MSQTPTKDFDAHACRKCGESCDCKESPMNCWGCDPCHDGRLTMGELLDIEAQVDATVPYYVPLLIAEIKRLRWPSSTNKKGCECGATLICANCASMPLPAPPVDATGVK